jgi:hypothetical protein
MNPTNDRELQAALLNLEPQRDWRSIAVVAIVIAGMLLTTVVALVMMWPR